MYDISNLKGVLTITIFLTEDTFFGSKTKEKCYGWESSLITSHSITKPGHSMTIRNFDAIFRSITVKHSKELLSDEIDKNFTTVSASGFEDANIIPVTERALKSPTSRRFEVSNILLNQIRREYDQYKKSHALPVYRFDEDREEMMRHPFAFNVV